MNQAVQGFGPELTDGRQSSGSIRFDAKYLDSRNPERIHMTQSIELRRNCPSTMASSVVPSTVKTPIICFISKKLGVGKESRGKWGR
jgi:hypothetical protein